MTTETMTEKQKKHSYNGGNREKCHRMSKVAAAVVTAFILVVTAGCTNGGGSTGGVAADGELTVHYLDVGQADSTLLVSGDEAMLIDTGNRDDADYILSYLDEQGIDELECIVFTHPHEDHMGSGKEIVQNIDVDKIYMLDGYDSGIALKLRKTIEAESIPTEAPEPGDKMTFGDCSIDFLGPVQDYKDVNDDSICLKVSHGDSRFLFTGDAGAGAERDMIEAGYDLETDVLQAGHHGSSTSNSYYFLRESNPKYAVISCGKGNMYGHPHEETLSRFSDLGAEVFRTDQQGTVIATDDGSGNISFNCEGKKAERKHTSDHEDAAYIGNLNSKKYHRPDCGGLPEEQNRVYFKSREGAEKAGYEPCGRCHPDE